MSGGSSKIWGWSTMGMPFLHVGCAFLWYAVCRGSAAEYSEA